MRRRALLLVLAAFVPSCAPRAIVHERPGNPHENLCGPGQCVSADEWRGAGPNPCPCPPGDAGPAASGAQIAPPAVAP